MLWDCWSAYILFFPFKLHHSLYIFMERADDSYVYNTQLCFGRDFLSNMWSPKLSSYFTHHLEWVTSAAEVLALRVRSIYTSVIHWVIVLSECVLTTGLTTWHANTYLFLVAVNYIVSVQTNTLQDKQHHKHWLLTMWWSGTGHQCGWRPNE